MELKTTEEFVREAHGAACSTWKTKIEKEFPELFKTELEIGRWYKGNVDFDSMIFITEIENLGNYNRVYYYGFISNTYRKGDYIANRAHEASLVPASDEEAKSALEKEIIKRFGEYWENAKIEAHADGEPWIGNGLNKGLFDSGIGSRKAFSKHGVLYSNGVFAEPLKEKTIITHEKALKIIAKKLKVSPESIEIK